MHYGNPGCQQTIALVEETSLESCPTKENFEAGWDLNVLQEKHIILSPILNRMHVMRWCFDLAPKLEMSKGQNVKIMKMSNDKMSK
jgi:hypothetical protein